MRIHQHLSWTSLRARLPRRTVRLRLTLVYGGLFLASGAVLLFITDLLWGSTTRQTTVVSPGVFQQILSNLPLRNAHLRVTGPPPGPRKAPNWIFAQYGVTPKQAVTFQGQFQVITRQQHSNDLHQLIVYSAIAIGIMAIVAGVLGWIVAGRVLRPLRTITSTARDISATNLHERLELQGPDDELKELGDTFDDLLERLEGSFDSQRQFVANASHELRTPLSTMRASLDVAMAKPGPLPEQTVVLAGRIREELDPVDQLLESLLALARAQRGPAADEATVSLDHLVAAAIERRAGAIADRHLTVEQERCAEASVTGSATLLARLVENLVDNAVKHNGAGGWIRAATEVAGDRVRLVVENGGPALDADSVDELAQPFRRLGSERTGSDTGSGLGLSIVAAVAESQGGALELHARPAGGLRVVVDLPVAVGELVGASA